MAALHLDIPQVMPLLNSSLNLSSLAKGCASALLLSVASLSVAIPSFATELPGAQRGVAAYASYTDPDYAAAEAVRLQNLLQSDVQINSVTVNGIAYQRLQSSALTRSGAQSLVSRAKAAGYSAWYLSSAAPADHSDVPIAPIAQTSALVTETPAAPDAPEVEAPVRKKILLTQENPELAAMLPEGPLLGEIFPPRAPVPTN